MATLILTLTGSAFLSLILGVFIDKGIIPGFMFLGIIGGFPLVCIIAYIYYKESTWEWRGNNE